MQQLQRPNELFYSFSLFCILAQREKKFHGLLGPDTPIRADYAAAVAGKKILEHQLELSLKNASVTLTSDGEEEPRKCALSG